MDNDTSLLDFLEAAYEIQIVATIERKTVLGIVDTNGRRWMWKKTQARDDEPRLRALAEMSSRLWPFGITMAAPVQNRYGRFLTVARNGQVVGFLQPWLEGRHVNVRLRRERHLAMEKIAWMHRHTQTVDRNERLLLQRGTLIGKLRMKEKTLMQVWPTVVQHCPELHTIEAAVWQEIRFCLKSYHRWWMEHGRQGQVSERNVPFQVFCHRDLAPHNLLWQKDETVAFIDFDHAGYDDGLHDLLQWVSHTLYLADIQRDEIAEMVTRYTEVYPLKWDRVELLWKLLRWPDILIRTAIEWYRQGCPAERKHRLLHAVAKENLRWKRVAEDCPFQNTGMPS